MRVKRGVTKRAKHKKVLKSAKGYRATYSKLYKRAHEAMMHAGQYSYIHRRHRRGQMRNQWIKIIAAGLVGTDTNYSRFISALKQKNVELDRKVMAEIVQTNPEHFAELVSQVTE